MQSRAADGSGIRLPGMVMLLLALSLLAVIGFERQSDGTWRLLENGRGVETLPQPVLFTGPIWFSPVRMTRNVQFKVPAGAIVGVVIPQDWRDAVRTIRGLSGAEEQKQLYIAFLKKAYGYQISELNRAYRLDASAFTELEASAFANLNETQNRVMADDLAFTIEFYLDRLENICSLLPQSLRLISLDQNSTPTELILALSAHPKTDAILLQNHNPHPIKGLLKPIILTHCIADRPGFATACLVKR